MITTRLIALMLAAFAALAAGCVIVVDESDEDGTVWVRDHGIHGPGHGRLLAEQIVAAYRADPLLADSRIGVSVDAEAVTLRGRIEREAQLTRAVQIARETPGVGSVVSRLVLTLDED